MKDTRIDTLIENFSERTLPLNSWTHKAHIFVALWHNYHFGFDEALKMVRKKIIAYNESVGTENSEDSGYHETLTRFWMVVTRNFLLEIKNPL